MNSLNVTVDTAVPLGLIVNELLTNTLEYAFLDGRKGKVLIALEKTVSGKLKMAVSDNGIGKSVSIHGTGIGRQLISLLTQQLDGTMTEEIDNGTHVYFKFKTVTTA